MGRRMVVFGLGFAFASVSFTASASAGGITGAELPVAKGVPGTVAADPSGLTAPEGIERYVELRAADGNVIARVSQDGGEVIRSASFRERLSIPAVAYDGTPAGLSADGETLVLLPPQRRGAGTTRLSVLDAERLRVRDRVNLNGRFSFDAISPDGSRIYLVEYTSPVDPTRYVVRAYDVRSGRLLADPIIDPNEPQGQMRGTAVTRSTSPDGRWAYTLYDGNEHPFIHALDTVDGRAVCIDLHTVKSNEVYRSTLESSPHGQELTVVDRKQGPLALVDTASFEVSEPSAPREDDAFPWLELILVPLGAVAGWALIRGLRRRRLAPGGAG